MKLFLLIFIPLLFFQCTYPDKVDRTPKDVAYVVKNKDNVKSSDLCTGEECCLEHKECKRQCDLLFYQSGKKVVKNCQKLPQYIVQSLTELNLLLRAPVLADLELLDLSQEFRLLLALDYRVWIRLIQDYKVDQARDVLIWLVSNRANGLLEELLELKSDQQYEILYELLASAGDRERVYGPVEQALAENISVNKSFFELLIDHSYYGLLQITHDMIKNKLCAGQYAGANKADLCALRIYCKEKPVANNEYVHSEDLRNAIVRNIQDEDFIKFLETEVLHTYSNIIININDPVMNNQVCFVICNDNNKSCE